MLINSLSFILDKAAFTEISFNKCARCYLDKKQSALPSPSYVMSSWTPDFFPYYKSPKIYIFMA